MRYTIDHSGKFWYVRDTSTGMAVLDCQSRRYAVARAAVLNASEGKSFGQDIDINAAARTITAKPLTTTLRNGTVVLAKMYKGEATERTYANRTQAEEAAKRHGGSVIKFGRPWLVMMTTYRGLEVAEAL